MAKTNFGSVDEYISVFPKDVQPILRRVRSVVRKAIPGAKEAISYRIPAYKLEGGTVIYFAGWKEHYSIYPVTDVVRKAFAGKLDPYAFSKGTLRFPLSAPVPVKLIEGIAKVRAQETRDRIKAKRASKAKHSN